MARFIIPTFQTDPEFEERVLLGNRRFILKFMFLDRTRAWYIDLLRDDRTPIVIGRRVSPGWGPLFGIPVDEGPDGLVYVRGIDPYLRADLGSTLLVVFLPREDIPVTVPSSEALLVELV